MTRDDVQKFAEALKEADIMFSLTTIMENNDEYWCYTGDEPAEIMCSAVVNIVSHLLDGGNSIEDIKKVFDTLLEKTAKSYAKRTKYLQ